MRRLTALLFVFLVGGGPAMAADSLPALAVQNRKYTDRHEFTGAVGLLPLDAFTKGVTFSGAYTLHFTDVLAWEVVQFFYSLPMETTLQDELRAFDLQPTPFERVEQYVTTNFVFKPLYWKGAWLNENLSYGEYMLLLGGGYGWMTRTQRAVINVGLATRIYASEMVSFRLDVRGLAFANADDVQNELWLGLGISL
jgi:outer membrane beta-barrel protein